MKKIGSTYVHAWIDKLPSQSGTNPFFKDKIVICGSFHPNPEKAFPPSDERKPFEHDPARMGPSNNEMIEYYRNENAKFSQLGLLNQDVFNELEGWSEKACVAFSTEFSDLETAKSVFEKAVESGVVDIYLYQNGQLIRKYD